MKERGNRCNKRLSSRNVPIPFDGYSIPQPAPEYVNNFCTDFNRFFTKRFLCGTGKSPGSMGETEPGLFRSFHKIKGGKREIKDR